MRRVNWVKGHTWVPMEGFEKLGIADWLCRHIASAGLVEPTEVQKNCIPPILEGIYLCAYM